MAKTQSGNIMTIAQSEFTEVIAIIRLHRSCALQAVNTEHVTMCWEIGKYISSHIQSGKWGDKVVEGLADYIHCADPTAKGFSKRNLYNMVRFYETYSTPQFIEESSHYQLDKILQTPSAQITLQPVVQIETPSVAFMQTPSAQMPVCLTMTTFSNHLDLLFFHRPLQCMVAIELKAGAFQPKDLGQLEFYMEALDRQVKRSNENPTIGILLCQTAEQMVVEYALSRSMSPTMVAEYKSRLIPSEVLQQTLTAYIEQNKR